MKQSLTMFILYVLFISESFIISVRVKQAYNLENKLKDVTNEFEKVKKDFKAQEKILNEIKEKYEKASKLNKELKSGMNGEKSIETKEISRRKELENKKRKLEKEMDIIKISLSSNQINSLLKNLAYFHKFYEQMKMQIKKQQMLKNDIVDTFYEIEKYFKDILSLYNEMSPKYDALFSKSKTDLQEIISTHSTIKEKVFNLQKQLKIFNYKSKLFESLKANEEYTKHLKEHCESRLTKRICLEDKDNCYWNNSTDLCYAY